MTKRSPVINLSRIEDPVLLRGNSAIAYRDPTAVWQDGTLFLYFTICQRDPDGRYYWFVGLSRSSDLETWTEPTILTPRDQKLNFCSPGNLIRHHGRWVICFSSYPTPNDEVTGDATARAWTMRSDDLVTWDKPELLRLKGPDVPVEQMGRIIDPYIFDDKDEPGKWWCFYKQNGVSMSWSRDLSDWTYVGSMNGGENACVLVDDAEYVLFHSPQNGIGVKRSHNVAEWIDEEGLITLGQEQWPWSQGRLTAGFVLDLREVAEIAKYVMFFHGTTREGRQKWHTHGNASLALAWSDDLKTWQWPGN